MKECLFSELEINERFSCQSMKSVQSERKLNFVSAFYHWREGASGREIRISSHLTSLAEAAEANNRSQPNRKSLLCIISPHPVVCLKPAHKSASLISLFAARQIYSFRSRKSMNFSTFLFLRLFRVVSASCCLALCSRILIIAATHKY